jgi:apolipoprotein D and lipocalin family protein
MEMKKTIIVIVITGFAVLFAAGAARGQGKRPLKVVPQVDLARYAGKWYEIARFPNRFQKRCAGEVTADYALQPAGRISVLNRCKLADGGQIQAEGVARVVGKGQPNSILKVRFAPAFLSFIPQVWGDYQIFALSPDYTHALVGDPSREYLWILSRSPRLDDAAYDRLVEEAKVQGFEIGKLVKTRQDGS